ncbi:nucleotidyltransferase family protein [Burkholderia multivorans]|uniref:nucleotidyltransferase family protein n=1 Tax=Burkholderia multivorans TaxID=87883 RepID=UPI0013DE995A|nr:nucleotidyltransferase domain-containing protein [Burkholderia multivorans]NGM78791.1 nucleotidyltransferase domain-containing protein [Burkholderia multivorans]
MDIVEIREIVTEWAASQPLIRKVWLFGSRVRGTERPDSDIDVAVEVRRLPGDSSEWTTFACERERLSAALQTLFPLPVQLEWYGGADETPTVHAGLQESSMMVYEASSH